MTLLTKKQIEDFNRFGFLIIPGLLAEADLSLFSLALRRIIQFQLSRAIKSGTFVEVPAGRECNLGMQLLEAIDHQYVAHINDCMYGMPEVLRLLSSENIRGAVNQLLRNDINSPLFCTNGSVVLAMPNDKNHTHGWHKDTFYTLPNSEYVQIWAPLVQDATIALGTLKVCSESHKRAWKGQRLVQDVGYIHRYQVSAEELERFSPCDVEMKVGETLFFHSGLAHSAGENISADARFSLVGIFHEIENETFSPKPEKTADEYFRELYGRTS